jgi:hypothetical protein
MIFFIFFMYYSLVFSVFNLKAYSIEENSDKTIYVKRQGIDPNPIFALTLFTKERCQYGTIKRSPSPLWVSRKTLNYRRALEFGVEFIPIIA